jgi:hypothetical protein
MDDASVVESVSSPEESADEPEPKHVMLTKEGVRCDKKLKIYIGKMENVSENICKMTDDLSILCKKEC